jgi:hypothetical protein
MEIQRTPQKHHEQLEGKLSEHIKEVLPNMK